MLTHYAYVGCRTTRERDARGEGIAVFAVEDTGSWRLVDVTVTRPNPSFLALDWVGRNLYAVHGDSTGMTAFRVGADGRLTEIDQTTTAGLNPVDVAVDPGDRFIVVTNHLSDSVVVRHRRPDDGFGDIAAYAQIGGTLGPHRTEQARVKPHQARFDPSGTRLVVPNKGADTVAVFDFDPATGALSERADCSAHLREGSGPRNVAFHQSLPILYVVCELDSTVCVLSMADDGRLDPVQTLPCLPDDFFGFSRAAAVVLSKDGGRLHVSNRGYDSVCTFEVGTDGRLSEPRWRKTLGRTPRFACLDVDGGLLVANEDSDTIVRMESRQGPASVVGETRSPTCVVFRAA